MSIDATNDDDDDDEEEEGGGNGRPRNLWHYTRNSITVQTTDMSKK